SFLLRLFNISNYFFGFCTVNNVTTYNDFSIIYNFYSTKNIR
ncbi:unnamed protein product, partial [Tenebrio molitor]